jgi:hypothetical protein
MFGVIVVAFTTTHKQIKQQPVADTIGNKI